MLSRRLVSLLPGRVRVMLYEPFLVVAGAPPAAVPRLDGPCPRCGEFTRAVILATATPSGEIELGDLLATTWDHLRGYCMVCERPIGQWGPVPPARLIR